MALARLKVKPEILAAAPPITSLIKTTVKGGLSSALEAMRFFTEDAEIRSFLKKYDSIAPSDRERLSWEAVALSAKVNVVYLLGAIQLAVRTHCWNKSMFIAVSNHPDVMEKRVKFAKVAGGEKDRTALDVSIGMQPPPKGNTFIGRQQVAIFGAGGAGNSKIEDGDGERIVKTIDPSSDIEDRLFGSDDLEGKLVKIRQRLLEG
jgi:hypothetical protein